MMSSKRHLGKSIQLIFYTFKILIEIKRTKINHVAIPPFHLSVREDFLMRFRIQKQSIRDSFWIIMTVVQDIGKNLIKIVAVNGMFAEITLCRPGVKFGIDYQCSIAFGQVNICLQLWKESCGFFRIHMPFNLSGSGIVFIMLPSVILQDKFLEQTMHRFIRENIHPDISVDSREEQVVANKTAYRHQHFIPSGVSVIAQCVPSDISEVDISDIIKKRK